MEMLASGETKPKHVVYPARVTMFMALDTVFSACAVEGAE